MSGGNRTLNTDKCEWVLSSLICRGMLHPKHHASCFTHGICYWLTSWVDGSLMACTSCALIFSVGGNKIQMNVSLQSHNIFQSFSCWAHWSCVCVNKVESYREGWMHWSVDSTATLFCLNLQYVWKRKYCCNLMAASSTSNLLKARPYQTGGKRTPSVSTPG